MRKAIGEELDAKLDFLFKKLNVVNTYDRVVKSENLFITDFAFHSIGVILSKLNKGDILLRFVQDTFIDGAVELIHLEPEDTSRLLYVKDMFTLDFDDAYQYAAAEKYNLIIVSLDADFDRTGQNGKGKLCRKNHQRVSHICFTNRTKWTVCETKTKDHFFYLFICQAA